MSREPSPRRRNTVPAVLAIPFISILISLVLFQLNITQFLENKVYDTLFYFRGPQEDGGNTVVIVAIDEKSVAQMGVWPWPRSRLADLIMKIKQGRPKVVGLDVILDIPTPDHEGGGDQDGRLAQAFAVPPVCVLPTVIAADPTGAEHIHFVPLDKFRTPYTRTGIINLAPDPVDNIVRQFAPVYGGTRLSFPLAVCLEYAGLKEDDIQVSDALVAFGPTRIPIDDGHSFINFRGSKINAFSAVDVLDPAFNAGFFFQDKIVLLGRTDFASKDMIHTPVPSRRLFETLPMAGVEVWKEICDMILQGKFLYKVPAPAVFLAVLILNLLICGATLRSNRRGILVMIAAALAAAFVFFGLFSSRGLVLPVFFITASAVLTYLLTLLFNANLTHREKRMITAAFKSYVSPQVLQDILSKKIDLKIGGRKKELTILFADIKNFTDFCDTREAEQALDLLREYFAEMNKIIIAHHGAVNKLMGDGILAIFGDFTGNNEHALDAVHAALRMQAEVGRLRGRLGYDLAIRVGINTGTVIVGNIGSEERLDYTAIGRDVNLAQRIEANCDPGKVLISETTYQAVKDKILVADQREVALKGFVRPVRVCTVIGDK